jgi:hypothetical protein
MLLIFVDMREAKNRPWEVTAVFMSVREDIAGIDGLSTSDVDGLGHMDVELSPFETSVACRDSLAAGNRATVSVSVKAKR